MGSSEVWLHLVSNLFFYIQQNTSDNITNTDPIPTAPPPAATTSSSPQPSSTDDQQQHHADPEEVDISNHYYQPATTNRIPTDDPSNISEAQLRQMMLGFDRTASPNAQTPGPDAAKDPMLKMLQQMMGGAGGSLPGGMPNPFAQAAAGGPFGAAMGQQQQQQQAATAAAGSDIYTTIWRILHFLLSLGLGLYIALWTRSTGTKLERERGAAAAAVAAGNNNNDDEEEATARRYFWWTFVTAEAVLLTSRFFLDRGRAAPGGFLWTIVGFLPDGPWKGYLATAMRYMQIFGTLREDLLMCVFVLVICSWWRG